MTKQSPPMEIVEVEGDRYASLEMAQAAALGDVALAVAIAVREGLAKGELVVVDGHVIFNEDHEDEQA